MTLKCLLLCSDDKIVRVLRRVLGDLEISVEHCTDADSAIRKLTRQRFESVIVDCTDEKVASLVLRSARSAPCNKRAVAVAVVDGQKALRSAFDLGAHFVLYKPVSSERAKASFRAARALMKCERRRNTRIAIQIPVTLVNADESGQQNTVSTDLSEGGMALQQFRRTKKVTRVRVQFTLPGTDSRSTVPVNLPGKMPASNRESASSTFRRKAANCSMDGSSNILQTWKPTIRQWPAS
jgi:CheY-like chemotaxis protein